MSPLKAIANFYRDFAPLFWIFFIFFALAYCFIYYEKHIESGANGVSLYPIA